MISIDMYERRRGIGGFKKTVQSKGRRREVGVVRNVWNVLRIEFWG